MRTVATLVTGTLLLILSSHALDAQQRDREPFAAEGIPAVALPDPPVEYQTAEGQGIRVTGWTDTRCPMCRTSL